MQQGTKKGERKKRKKGRRGGGGKERKRKEKRKETLDVVNTFRHSTQDAEAVRPLWLQDQHGLHSETVSQKERKQGRREGMEGKRERGKEGGRESKGPSITILG